MIEFLSFILLFFIVCLFIIVVLGYTYLKKALTLSEAYSQATTRETPIMEMEDGMAVMANRQSLTDAPQKRLIGRLYQVTKGNM